MSGQAVADLFHPAGLVGALVGAVVGYINFRLVTGVVTERLRALDRSPDEAARREFEGKLVLMKRIVFVATVPVVALVGYTLGRAVAG